MGMSKKAVVILVPSLLFGIGAPAWSGTAEQMAPADVKVMSASPKSNTLLNLIGSILTATDPSPRQMKEKCKPSQLYSSHDLVGDPDACFMNRYTLSNGSTAVGGAP